ncbi:MAG: pyridoxamine kinase [Desulfovibrionaceae bacterium]|nr:pyridoxamine kinase [Desulfovibrionaceae bacterium]
MRDYPLKRVCAVHDLSGFGRASLTLAIPILSCLGFQVCPLPTAVLSSQTSGINGFSFLDLTSEMPKFLEHWRKLDLKFACVYSGFLGNPSQIEIAETLILDFLTADGLAFVDPVLGDNGCLDPTQTEEMVAAQRHLVSKAKVIAPNLTEASFLLGANYEQNLPQKSLKDWLRALSSLGPKIVVITSAPADTPDLCAVVAFERETNRFFRLQHPKYPIFYPGTGDTFSSCLAGFFLQGKDLPQALALAVEFVHAGIKLTYEAKSEALDGVLLEKTLPLLLNPSPLSFKIEEF